MWNVKCNTMKSEADKTSHSGTIKPNIQHPFVTLNTNTEAKATNPKNVQRSLQNEEKHNYIQEALLGATRTVTSICQSNTKSQTNEDTPATKNTEARKQEKVDFESNDQKFIDDFSVGHWEDLDDDSSGNSALLRKKDIQIIKQGAKILNQDQQNRALKATIVRQEGIIMKLEEKINEQDQLYQHEVIKSFDKKTKLKDEQDGYNLKQGDLITGLKNQIVHQDSIIFSLGQKNYGQKEKLQEQHHENQQKEHQIEKQLQELAEISSLCASLKFLLSQPRHTSEESFNGCISQDGLNLHQMQALDLAGLQPSSTRDIPRKFLYQRDKNEKQLSENDDYIMPFELIQQRPRTSSQYCLMPDKQVKASLSQNQLTVRSNLSVRKKERKKLFSEGDLLASRSASPQNEDSRKLTRKSSSFSRKGSKKDSKERVAKLLKACYKVYI